jgi:hypothetical protein
MIATEENRHHGRHDDYAFCTDVTCSLTLVKDKRKKRKEKSLRVISRQALSYTRCIV